MKLGSVSQLALLLPSYWVRYSGYLLSSYELSNLQNPEKMYFLIELFSFEQSHVIYTIFWSYDVLFSSLIFSMNSFLFPIIPLSCLSCFQYGCFYKCSELTLSSGLEHWKEKFPSSPDELTVLPQGWLDQVLRVLWTRSSASGMAWVLWVLRVCFTLGRSVGAPV